MRQTIGVHDTDTELAESSSCGPLGIAALELFAMWRGLRKAEIYGARCRVPASVNSQER